MTIYKPPTDWNYSGPRTNDNAILRAFRNVDRARAVSITNGSYRKATINGVFELADSAGINAIRVYPSGKRKVNVVCEWFGGMPPSKEYIQIDVTGEATRPTKVEMIESYCGPVVCDLGIDR